MRSVRRALTLIVISASLCCVLSAGAFADEGGGVLPASAKPHGWSLTRMTGALALFSTGGNNPAHYPTTPFQVLYVKDSSTGQVVPVDGGFEAIESSTFTVPPGTAFFVPVWNADDSPPVVGTWPTNHASAVSYFFDPAQVGGRGFNITIDGRRTPLGSGYLAGPVTTAPLLDGGGTHILTLGAFLHPLTPGTHTVSIGGGVFGQQIYPTYGFAFFEQAITYTVIVGRDAD